MAPGARPRAGRPTPQRRVAAHLLHRKATASLTAAVLLLLGADAAEAAPCGTDEFSGAALDGARWTVLRPAGPALPVADGALRLPIRAGALLAGTATAGNVALQAAPDGGWTATARFGVGALDAPGERAGLVLWRSEGVLDNTFATVTFTRAGSGERRFEALSPTAASPQRHAPAAAPPCPPACRPTPPSTSGSARTAAASPPRTRWTRARPGRRWAARRISGPVRVGMVALADDEDAAGGTVPFERFTLSCGPEVELTSAPERGTAVLEVGASAAVSDDVDDERALQLAWDFGDGTTGEGSQLRLHKYRTPGTHRLTLSATDSDGNVTTAARTVTVLAAEPPCPPASDDFGGNALDPRWTPLRSIASGLDVRAGHLWLRPYGGDLAGAVATARNVVLRPGARRPVDGDDGGRRRGARRAG